MTKVYIGSAVSGGAIQSSPYASQADLTAVKQGASAYKVTGGTADRTDRDRWSDVVNVKDFGAQGAGGDDSAAVAAALAVAAASGRPLYFPAGSYIVNTITPANYMRVYGAGLLTILRPKDPNAEVFRIDNTNPANGYAVEIDHLRIDGSSSGTGHGIYAPDPSYGAAMAKIHDMWINGVGGDGIHLEGVWASEIAHVVTNNTGGHGFYVRNVYNTFSFRHCYPKAVGSGKAGFRVLSGQVGLYTCNGTDVADYWGIFGGLVSDGDPVDATATVTMDGCNVEDFHQVGVWFKNNTAFTINNTQFAAPITGTVVAIRAHQTNGRILNLFGPGNKVISKGASWANGYEFHSVYFSPPFLRFSTPTTIQYSHWNDNSGFANRTPTMTPYVNTSQLKLIGGAVITLNDDDAPPQARIKEHMAVSAGTWAPGSVANGATASTIVTVSGAAVGDTVLVGWPAPAGVLVVGSVTSTNTVTVTMLNQSGSPQNLSSTLRVDVWQHY